jgi:7-cyano-7-deazaguanine synthase
MTKVFVALSGGIDSTTVLAVACDRYMSEDVTAVSFHYGQRHEKEIEAAQRVAEAFGVKHEVIDMPMNRVSMLTDPSQEVPNVAYGDIVGVSPTYVPFRNGLMLAMLAQLAAPDPNSDDDAVIMIGCHAEDAENDAYPDCRLDFVGTMGAAIHIGTYYRVKVSAPLIELYKWEIVALGTSLDAPYELTWSCYKGEELQCGICPTCRARKQGFIGAGVGDPTEYADERTPDELAAADADIDAGDNIQAR